MRYTAAVDIVVVDLGGSDAVDGNRNSFDTARPVRAVDCGSIFSVEFALVAAAAVTACPTAAVGC